MQNSVSRIFTESGEGNTSSDGDEKGVDSEKLLCIDICGLKIPVQLKMVWLMPIIPLGCGSQ